MIILVLFPPFSARILFLVLYHNSTLQLIFSFTLTYRIFICPIFLSQFLFLSLSRSHLPSFSLPGNSFSSFILWIFGLAYFISVCPHIYLFSPSIPKGKVSLLGIMQSELRANEHNIAYAAGTSIPSFLCYFTSILTFFIVNIM